MNKEEQLEIITFNILPFGAKFSKQQKDAILSEGNANVVAGPGTGKTTVLIAKCALLLKEYMNSHTGICLITHTNVAVDEIKMGLKKLGFDSIEYPNFIGTIQEFMNNFFAKKAFHLLLRKKQFRVLDNDEYQEKFNVVFEQTKPHWYTRQPPRVSNKVPKLNVNNDLSFYFISSAPQSYSNAFNESIKLLFSQGYVTNHQCLELADWYLNNYSEQLRKAIHTRFKYVLLDEAQDTNQLQYKVLNTLFTESNVCFQKFGDPYQALFSIYEGNNDAWIPSTENKVSYDEISETSRFGTSIAEIVKNVCIEKYDTFQSLDLVGSFDPYYIIYNNGKDLIEQYKALVSFCNKESDSFFHSKKKDTILAAFHNNLSSLFTNYVRPSREQQKNDSIVRKNNNFLLSLLSKEIDISFKELKEKIDSHLDCKVIISKCIKEIVSENVSYNIIANYLEVTLKYLTDNKLTTFSKVNIKKEVDDFRKRSSEREKSQSTEDISEFYFGTVHSAKGETHRSTLLVLNTIFENYEENTKYSMFNLLKEYLAGDYTDPKRIIDDIEKDETIKALKLAYVALSRPTHLLAIAIPEEVIPDDSDILERLNNNGWIKHERL